MIKMVQYYKDIDFESIKTLWPQAVLIYNLIFTTSNSYSLHLKKNFPNFINNTY